MKRFLTGIVALTLALSLVACGGKKDDVKDDANNDTTIEGTETPGTETPETPETETPGTETPEAPNAEAPASTKEDLAGFVQNYVASFGEDSAPMLMDMTAEEEMFTANFPGLADVKTKQMVLQTAAISAVAFELDLIEVENAEDVETVKGILEARKAYMVEQGAYYPATAEAWEKANVVVNGNFVALIATGEEQANTEAAFNALFA